MATETLEFGDERPDVRIGRYKLLQELGEGGFGTVWMAQQEEPVRRTVAVKVLKLGMDTKQVVARFEAERQALALMDHPNIAKVLDGGATENGRPFFVMELVKGVPITKYCDEANLPTPQRLALFRQVCGAVQHAHQKGIIHRDLKPSNVLVALSDGVAVPKVIDFGIAKATTASLTERTMFTERGQMLGTPEYMAPEQAESSGLDVDTRADIYSLGVMLYELLTGTKPFELKTLIARGYSEIVRHIREVDPPKPSTRISSLGERAPLVAKHRRVQPRQLGKDLRGDLDWIVMKALEKDRSRRYETAAALVDDLDRFLGDRPVLASPPSRAYRLRKYVKRHRLGVGAAAAIFLSLVAGLVASTSGYVEAKSQRDRATKAAARATAVLAMLQSMLGSADPYEGKEKDKDYTLRQLLDDFDAGLPASLADEPEVAATVHAVMGRAYRGLAENDKSERHLRTSLEMHRRAFGPEEEATLHSLAEWIQSLHAKGDYAGAERAAVEGLEAARRRSPENFLVARFLNERGVQLGMLERRDEAEASLRESLAMRERLLGRDDMETGFTLYALAFVLLEKDDPGDAESLLRRYVEILKVHRGPDHPNIAMALDNLGRLASARGDKDEAEKLFREAISIQRRRLGDEHPDLATTLCSLGSLERSRGRLAEAEPLYREAAAIYRKRLGGGHADLATALHNLAATRRGRGDLAEAEGLSKEAVAIYRASYGPTHPTFLVALGQLAEIRRQRGDPANAEPLLRELAEAKRADPDWSVSTAHATNHAAVLTDLAYLEKAPARGAQAESILRGLLTTRPARISESDWTVFVVKNMLADAIAAQGTRLDQAEALARESCAALADGSLYPAPARRSQARTLLRRMARFYETLDRLAPKEGSESRAADWKRRLADFDAAASSRAASAASK